MSETLGIISNAEIKELVAINAMDGVSDHI